MNYGTSSTELTRASFELLIAFYYEIRYFQDLDYLLALRQAQRLGYEGHESVLWEENTSPDSAGRYCLHCIADNLNGKCKGFRKKLEEIRTTQFLPYGIQT